MNTLQITDAHRALVTAIIRNLSIEAGAQLIADHDAAIEEKAERFRLVTLKQDIELIEAKAQIERLVKAGDKGYMSTIREQKAWDAAKQGVQAPVDHFTDRAKAAQEHEHVYVYAGELAALRAQAAVGVKLVKEILPLRDMSKIIDGLCAEFEGAKKGQP